MRVNWPNRRKYVVVGLAAIAVMALLGVFAVELAQTQARTREGIEIRYKDRARVISALTEAIFASTALSPETTASVSGPVVSQRALAAIKRNGNLEYALVLDDRGHIVASSPGIDAAGRARLRGQPDYVKAALLGPQYSVSSSLPLRSGGGARRVVELVQAFRTPRGRRVLVTGLPGEFVDSFLGRYLARSQTPSAGGTAYVLDGRGNIIGAADPSARAGAPVPDPGLIDALNGFKLAGAFGKDGYFAAASVPNTPWRVVLAASEADLFSSVSGGRKLLPWLILASFGLAAALALGLLSRTLRTAGALARSNTDLRDANSQLAGTNALLRRAAELARSNAELEQFASIASHDLQEPLRKVQTFAAQLNTHERDRLSDEGQDYLRRMSDAAGRMRMLIDDLLMFSRVSTQGRAFVEVDLGDVARQVVTDLEVTIAEAGATVVIDPLPTVCADRSQIGQLFQNLIANALKFRRDGIAPEVRVGGTVSDGTASITVEDNGIGFDSRYASRIFRAFERLHSRTDYPGTGIGLALCRKIVERHHGTIVAEGTPGAGAVFTVMVPVEQPTDDSDAADEPVPDPTPAHA